MTQPDYPLLVLPSYEMYQLAHIATFLADALVRHRLTTDRGHQHAALQDVNASRLAMQRVLGSERPVGLPLPLDTATFHAARGLLALGPRWAHVVSLAPTGQSGWAVVGYVPGVGPVGARTASRPVADAVCHHLLTQPAVEVAPWAIDSKPYTEPRLPDRQDLANVVNRMDPRRDRDRMVARHLRGIRPSVDVAIGHRFAGKDLDAPPVVRPPAPAARPPAPQPAASPQRPVSTAAGPRPESRHLCGIGRQVTTRSAPSAPATNAGP